MNNDRDTINLNLLPIYITYNYKCFKKHITDKKELFFLSNQDIGTNYALSLKYNFLHHNFKFVYQFKNFIIYIFYLDLGLLIKKI